MWKTVIEIKDTDKSRVTKMSESISKIDNSFSYKIECKKYGVFLIIYSDSKNKAHKRGMLLTKRYLPAEEGEEYFYWIKEGQLPPPKGGSL